MSIAFNAVGQAMLVAIAIKEGDRWCKGDSGQIFSGIKEAGGVKGQIGYVGYLHGVVGI